MQVNRSIYMNYQKFNGSIFCTISQKDYDLLHSSQQEDFKETEEAVTHKVHGPSHPTEEHPGSYGLQSLEDIAAYNKKTQG